MVAEYKKHGIDTDGGFNPNFHLWDNQDAARAFRIGMKKLTDDVLLKPGPLDVPFALKNDPFLSMLFQFTSYMFTATNKFTIPLLTNPDSQMLVGSVLMMAAGSMIGPLRQLAYGSEVDLSPGALAKEAIANSGIFGLPIDILMKVNARLDLAPLRFLQPDRFKRDTGGFEAGPAASLAGYASSFLSALAAGEMNERDLKKGMKLLMPFSGTWYTRRLLDKAVKSFGLAETRADAQAYSLGD
jgi:hypothetical protein